jgi:hypothetical protein
VNRTRAASSIAARVAAAPPCRRERLLVVFFCVCSVMSPFSFGPWTREVAVSRSEEILAELFNIC